MWSLKNRGTTTTTKWAIHSRNINDLPGLEISVVIEVMFYSSRTHFS